MSVHAANETTYDSFGRWRTQTYADPGDVSAVDQTLYIKGSELIDGSIRLRFETGEENANMESRASGVWNDTGLRLSSSTLQLGRDMNLSALAGFLETINPSAVVGHQRSLIPHIQFDDATGTTKNQLHIPIANIEETFVLFSNATSEITDTTIGQIISDSPGRILSTSIHEVGTTAASAEVTVSWFVGTDNTGILVNKRILPASDLIANTTLTIDYDEDFGIDDGVSYFMEFTSTANFSLKTDSGGNILITHTGHALEELIGVTENLIYNNVLGHVLNNSLDPVYVNQF